MAHGTWCGLVLLSATILCDTIIASDDDSHDYPGPARESAELVVEEGLCSPGTHCTPLGNCVLIRDLLDQACVTSLKMRELACGYVGIEPMVCCPRGANYSPFPYKPRAASYSPQDPYSPASTRPLFNPYPSGCPPTYPGAEATRSPNLATVDNGIYKPWGDTMVPATPGSGVNTNCGQSIVRDFGDDKLGAHPWVVRVGFLDVNTRRTSYACLGTIISPTVILTSAKCANASNKNHYLSTVRVGDYDSKTDPDCNSKFCASPVKVHRISKAIIHAGYDPKTYKDNIAILILNTSIQFSVAAQPICVLQSGQVPLVGRRGFLVGWGKSTNVLGQEVTPSRQQQIELPIVSLVQCSQTYGEKVPITNEQLCAGGEKKKDACTGFTGAPLVLLEHLTFSRYYLVGIMSFGSDKCGRDGTPSVFTSVHNYADWIKENMG